MKPDNSIAAQVAALPLSESDRREALHYVAVGESLAGVLISIGHWLDQSPAMKPAYQD